MCPTSVSYSVINPFHSIVIECVKCNTHVSHLLILSKKHVKLFVEEDKISVKQATEVRR